MPVNPYEPPKSPLQSRAAGPRDLSVEGDQLVCGPAAILPRRCIVTNETIPAGMDAKLRRRELITGQIFKPNCWVEFSLSAKVRRHQLAMRWAGMTVMILGLAIILAKIGGLHSWPVPGTVVFLWMMVGYFLYSRGNTLQMVGYREGRFWLKGCSPAFLASLQTEDS